MIDINYFRKRLAEELDFIKEARKLTLTDFGAKNFGTDEEELPDGAEDLMDNIYSIEEALEDALLNCDSIEESVEE